jgi:FlaA1/EpsC-like NDP-sugar epimerase
MKEKSFLITGGTGSFGHAYTSYLLKNGAERVVVFSRDEVKQAEMRDEFKNDQRLRFFIGDVRDRERLRRAFDGVDVVIHAAALKRIEVGQYNPMEMVKTNVIGAMNVVEAAMDSRDVAKVVALSTDKAFQPISPYGQSKALAEAIFLNANNARGWNGPKFSVTRYGNVAFSRGSVIPKWISMMERGEQIKVTDPGCTRFWMTIDEACDLVTKAVNEMPETVLLPQLPAYRLGDLAEALFIDPEITGLPAWEKKHESLAEGYSSETAPRMTVEQIREAVKSTLTQQLRAA